MAPSVAPTTARLQALSPRDDTSWIKPREGAAVPAGEGTGEFKCDGRTHCSHMRSCAEAAFFIQHCPNTEMDGDGDGVPCERQWC
ncbi:MAG: excalibur calcium-binding domain-containing protein [Burkholderiales bacterium]|nr:MAG: excalibur calcium-binding domain-containing protein [Burkholderiales bacterium]